MWAVEIARVSGDPGRVTGYRDNWAARRRLQVTNQMRFDFEVCRSWKNMDELVFEVTQESDGGYCAECLTENIFTQADSWDELRRNVIEAVHAFFFDGPVPASVRLLIVRDEILTFA